MSEKHISDNALLQKNILLRLESGPVCSVARLARFMGGSRPSTSRAINYLAQIGFTSKGSEGWTLTQAGYDELRRLSENNRKPGMLAPSGLENGQLAEVLREAARRLEALEEMHAERGRAS